MAANQASPTTPQTRSAANPTSNPDVYVITGGAGGMGIATAEILGTRKTATILLSDINEDVLNDAKQHLTDNSKIKATIETQVCDVSNPDDATALAQKAVSLGGTLRGVVHTAGVSPSMGDAEKILEINVAGTIYIDRAFLPLATDGFTMVNVASMAAYMLPNAMLPKRAYKAVAQGPTHLLAKLAKRVNLLPKSARPGLAYSISKNFVTWYTGHLAGVFGAADAHIVSVSPGSFDTKMGQLEKDAGAGAMVDYAAIKRFGRPEEVGQLLAWLVRESPVYLTGTDILIDGGVVSQMSLKDMMAAGSAGSKKPATE